MEPDKDPMFKGKEVLFQSLNAAMDAQFYFNQVATPRLQQAVKEYVEAGFKVFDLVRK